MLALNKSAMSVYTPPQPMQALGLALLVELALLVGIAIIIAQSMPVQPKISPPVALTIISEITPPTPISQPKPLPPAPQPKVTRPHPAKPQPSKPVPPTPAPPTPPAPLAPAPSPTAFTVPALPPAPPAPPPMASNVANLDAEYADKIRAAVQAAVFYPPAAAAMHFSGRVQVAFHLQDGVPGETRIVTSSGLGILDRAALQAVQAAQYPAPPEDLRGKYLPYQIWIALILTHY